ncbi:MAG: ABC transporter substrate-binding protein [Prevotella sp.]|nr:ABC transporter substrate-binding protein [Prevotella sp.]
MKHISYLIVLLLLCACSKEQTKEEVQQVTVGGLDDDVLRIAVTPTLDCLPLYLAQQEGWFTREDISVQLIPYQAQMDQDTAIERRRVHGMTTDTERMAWLQQHDTPVEQVATTTLSWQLITNKAARLTLLTQLDDKMVAMTRHSATDMLAQQAIDQAGLQSEHVFRIQINDINVRLSMLQNGIMDAMFLPEPQATLARLDGHPVLMSTEETGQHLGVLVFRSDVMADTAMHSRVERFVKVYQQASDSIAARGLANYRSLIASTCHVRPEIVDSIGKLKD